MDFQCERDWCGADVDVSSNQADNLLQQACGRGSFLNVHSEKTANSRSFGSILCCHCKREPDLGYRRRALFNAIFLAISPTTLCLWNLHTFKNILCFHIKP